MYAAAPIMVPKRPSKAKADRQPRQSNGAAIPPMRPAVPAPPAAGPAATGARGMKVGLRLENGEREREKASVKSVERCKSYLHRISVNGTVGSWPDGHDAVIELRSPINNDLIYKSARKNSLL